MFWQNDLLQCNVSMTKHFVLYRSSNYDYYEWKCQYHFEKIDNIANSFINSYYFTFHKNMNPHISEWHSFTNLLFDSPVSKQPGMHFDDKQMHKKKLLSLFIIYNSHYFQSKTYHAPTSQIDLVTLKGQENQAI